jgi:hypothetical protein
MLSMDDFSKASGADQPAEQADRQTEAPHRVIGVAEGRFAQSRTAIAARRGQQALMRLS